MHVSPFDDLPRRSVASRASPSRRIGVILSVLFLTSVGTVATVTSARESAHGQAGAQIAIAPPSSIAAR